VRIELQRAVIHGDLHPRDCAICERHFEPGVVQSLMIGDEVREGYVCRECALNLGRQNPWKFPTPEEYEEADRRYPSSTFTTEEEYDAAVKGDPHAEYRASLVSLA